MSPGHFRRASAVLNALPMPLTDGLDQKLLREAMIRPKVRRPTRPTLGSKQRRLEGKKHRGDIKAGRGARRFDD